MIDKLSEKPAMIGIDFSDHHHAMRGEAPSANIVVLSEQADIVLSKRIEAGNMGELYKKVLLMVKDLGARLLSKTTRSASYVTHLKLASQVSCTTLLTAKAETLAFMLIRASVVVWQCQPCLHLWRCPKICQKISANEP